MIGPIFEFEDLQRLFRPSMDPSPSRASVEAWARKIGLKFTYNDGGGILTTVQAVNAAIGVQVDGDQSQLRPEDLF